jgi:hypothetical protein
MEDVLEVYARPFDSTRPVVCLDEASKQLLSEIRAPLGPVPGSAAKFDFEYERAGTANLFMICEPLAGWRCVKATERRTRVDWARAVKELCDVHYPRAEKIVLVMDNLNTHDPASLYQAFEPAEARRLLERLEIHKTPKHGSWLNVAEIELSAMQRQCLARRLPTIERLDEEATAWAADRNARQTGVEWHFTTADARLSLKSLYPKILMG